MLFLQTLSTQHIFWENKSLYHPMRHLYSETQLKGPKGLFIALLRIIYCSNCNFCLSSWFLQTLSSITWFKKNLSILKWSTLYYVNMLFSIREEEPRSVHVNNSCSCKENSIGRFILECRGLDKKLQRKHLRNRKVFALKCRTFGQLPIILQN